MTSDVDEGVASLVLPAACAMLVMAASMVWWWRHAGPRMDPSIPWAPHAVPVFGHALAYVRDPYLFLRSAGRISRINIAGRHTILVGAADHKAVHQISFAPEQVLSGRQAIGDLGFDLALGDTILIEGPRIHRQVLKDDVMNQVNTIFLPTLLRKMKVALALETRHLERTPAAPNRLIIPDLFALVRRCLMRTALTALVGRCMLVESSLSPDSDDDDDDGLVNDLMKFQDKVEDAIAKGTIFPRRVADFFFLRPVARLRRCLQEKIAARILCPPKNNEEEEDDDDIGPWLKTMATINNDNVEFVSEVLIGLIFAAHMNPTIGSSQALCFLLTQGSADERHAAKQQANKLLQRVGHHLVSANQIKEECPVLYDCVVESMRLIAHPIGTLRLAKENFTLEMDDGTHYKIYRGEVIAISHIVYNTDTAFWGEKATTYQPRRHTEKNGSSMSFSRGVHACPGEQLAKCIMVLMLALMLERNPSIEDKLPHLSFDKVQLAQRKGPVVVTIDGTQ